MRHQPGDKNPGFIPCLPFYAIAALYLLIPAVLLLAGIPVIGAIDYHYINIEYLLIGAVGIFLPKPVTFTLLIVEFAADCFWQICMVYRVSPSQLLTLVRYVPFLPASRIAGGSVVVLLGVFLCLMLSTLRPKTNEQFRTAGTLLCLLICLFSIEVSAAKNPIWKRDANLIPTIVRVPSVSIFLQESFRRMVIRNSAEGDDTGVTSASSHLISGVSGRLAERRVNVVLVVVESWGRMDDTRAEHRLIEAYDTPQIKGSYLVEHGEVPFRGGTVSGEARELCESGMGFRLLQISPARAANCLPRIAQERGYHTLAVHGYIGGMFLRNEWYPRMGFDESFFLPDLEKRGLAHCDGALPGICDGSIAELIGQRLLAAPADQPQFIYWVTLNSHIPVPAQTDIADDRSCANDPELSSSTALCSWYRLVRAVHNGVAEDAIKLINRPTVFLIVGDHAPPFRNPQLRHQFSATEVPYVMLVPSELSRDRGAPVADKMLMAKTSTPHTKLSPARGTNPQAAAF